MDFKIINEDANENECVVCISKEFKHPDGTVISYEITTPGFRLNPDFDSELIKLVRKHATEMPYPWSIELRTVEPNSPEPKD